MGRGTLVAVTVAVAIAASGAAATGAAAQALPQAATLGVPQVYGAPGSMTCANCVAVPTAAPPGFTYASPYQGTVTQWTADLAGSGTAALVVLRPTPTSASTYQVISSSAPRDVGPGAATYSFPTSQAVQPGDVVAIAVTAGASVLTGSASGGAVGTAAPNGLGGVTVTSTTPGTVLSMRATVVRTPAVSGVAPTSGPTAGGTPVTISGQNLDTVTSVDFGGVPAQSFTIDGFESITAVTPPGAAGTVGVTVSGPTGASGPAFATFTFQAPAPPPLPPPPLPPPPVVERCHVPDLEGRTLRRARIPPRLADCDLGEVTRPPRKRHRGKLRVTRQAPRAGAVRRAGREVDLRLRYRRPARG